MINISLCMIVRDESLVLARCLESARDIADEIIVVDTGSTDDTVEIAKRFTDKVFEFEWCDDFSAARNFSFSKAGSEYILWLDADDVIEQKDRLKFLQLKESLDKSVDTVFMKYVLSRKSDGSAEFVFNRERLLRNCPAAFWQEPVHEVIAPFGKSYYSDIEITHKKERKSSVGRNLKIIDGYLKKHGGISPRLLFYYARELKDANRLDDAITAFTAFINGNGGWVEDKITACLDLSRIYKSQKDEENDLNILLKSLSFGCPRPDTACLFGEHFLNKKNYKTAAFWYESALALKPEDNALFFATQSSYTFTPSIWLAVIYDRLGNLEKAQRYNDLAGTFNPDHPSYLYNKDYFEKKLKKTDS